MASRLPEKMDREEFLARVARDFPFEVDGGMEQLVRTVLRSLRAQISDGELDDVRASVPKEVASLFA